MTSKADIPKLPRLTERVVISLREGTEEVLEKMAKQRGFLTVPLYIRGLVEREIKVERPADFKRLRGVA